MVAAPPSHAVLNWYLLAIMLKARSSCSIDFPGKQNQQPPEALHIEIKGGSENLKHGPRLPEPKWMPDSEWMFNVREKVKIARKDDVASTWGKLCIYKVPHYLRDGEDKAYMPNIVSLGPYHHGRKRLTSMHRHKWRAFNQILTRCDQDAKLYLASIKELEERARACYEGHITISSNDFVEMMVLDGCFALEVFQGAAMGFEKLGYPKCDPVFSMRGSMHLIQRDMIMLENQIPLFILDTLFELQLPSGRRDRKGLVAKMARWFFSPLMPSPLMPTGEQLSPSEQSDLHCLHVFRQNLLCGTPQKEPSYRSQMESSVSRPSEQLSPSEQSNLHCLHVFRQNLLCGRPQKEPSYRSQMESSVSRPSEQLSPSEQSGLHCKPIWPEVCLFFNCNRFYAM